MGLQDKISEYKEKQETKRFFNENNDEKLGVPDYLKALIVGAIVAIVGGYLLQLIANITGYNFVYLYMLVGYGVGYGIRKVIKTGNLVLGAVSALAYFIGVSAGLVLFYILQMGMGNVSDRMMMMYFKSLFSHIPTLIVIVVGAVAAFMSAKD